ncbi:hypothetical protein BH10PSE17_BH10PSE17_26000 [soil metagenome]
MSNRPSFRRLPVAICVLQGLLVATWTAYALLLVPLAERAGIAASAVVWILFVDQVIFVVSDWASGIYADWLSRTLRRIGPSLILAALLSGALLCLLPSASQVSPAVFVATAFVWACTSSFLRAPVFALLARASDRHSAGPAISVSLVGVGIAGALGPLLTQSLRGLDPLLPFAVASVAITAVTLALARIEAIAVPDAESSAGDRRSAARIAAVPSEFRGATRLSAMPDGLKGALREVLRTPDYRGAIGLAALAACGALAVQGITVLMPQNAAFRGLLPAPQWNAAFWTGFSLALAPAALGASRHYTWRAAGIGFGIGTLLLALLHYQVVHDFALIVIAVLGACWAIGYTFLLTRALDTRPGLQAGIPIGLLLSGLSLAAALRLLIVATGLQAAMPVAALCAACWAVTAAACIAMPIDASRTSPPAPPS